MKRIVVMGAIAVCCLGLGYAKAGFAVDQQQLSGTTNMAFFSQSDLVQSFQQSRSNITGAAIELKGGYGTSGNITISVYNNLPSNGGTLLASGTDNNVAAGKWASVQFGSSIAITPNQTYYLVFSSSNPDMAIAGDTTGSYSHGHVYANSGYQAYSDFDYAFKTFADDSKSNTLSSGNGQDQQNNLVRNGKQDPLPAPEPASFLALSLGTAAMLGGIY